MHESNPITTDQLLERLGAGAVVLTGNARLSRSLMEAYAARMAARGVQAWATPRVLPLGSWLREAWQEAVLLADAAPPRLLNAEQEVQLWAEIVRGDRGDLMRPDAAARRARESHAALLAWDIHLGDRRFADGEAAEQFRHWANRFTARCEREGLVTEAQLPALLTETLQAGAWTPPAELVLTGFFELTPAQHALAQALDKAGTQVEWRELRGERGEAVRHEAADPDAELATAARWARHALETDPAARIGIVVPDLEARRAQVATVLAATLEPKALAPGELRRTHAFNLSLGAALAEAPLVRLAFSLLSFTSDPVRTETLGRALRSPLWAAPADAETRRETLARRALLDAQLRKRGDQALSLDSAAWWAARRPDDKDGPESGTGTGTDPDSTDSHEAGAEGEQAGGNEDAANRSPYPYTCPQLAQRLRALEDARRELPRTATTAQWATHFTAWLTSAGWAKGRPLDSAEYQAREAWHELLTRFAGLDDFGGAMERDTALATLRRMAAETPWQPKSPAAPVQVLGLLEALGQRFDHLWVMGLHDAAWPRAPLPDPFLPLGIQRERGMPGCGPAREAALAAELTERLCHAAPNVVFSYPKRDGDEPRTPSPLLEPFAPVAAEDLPLSDAPGWVETLQASAETEQLAPGVSIPLAAGRARGGSGIVRNQANCPFRAFAEHRLGAQGLEEPRPGLDPMRRGSLLHKVLERTWKALKTHAALAAMDEDQRATLVHQAVSESLEEIRKQSPQTMGRRFIALETERLVRTVLGWLSEEEKRAPFEAVGFEKKMLFETEGVTMRVVIDRIDRLPDGRTVVLDYKTGLVSPGKWFGPRPEDPQLPLYTVALRGAASEPGEPIWADIAAVAFAQIRPGDARFKGVVAEDGLLPGLPGGSKQVKEAAEHWPDVLDEWQEEIEGLARGFREGEATVDPKRGTNTCQQTWCELAPLCRIGERAAPADDDAGEGPGGDGPDADVMGANHMGNGYRRDA